MGPCEVRWVRVGWDGLGWDGMGWLERSGVGDGCECDGWREYAGLDGLGWVLVGKCVYAWTVWV